MMGAEVAAVGGGEKTLLEIVKEAANSDHRELFCEDIHPFPSIIAPAWLRHLDDSQDGQGGEILTRVPLSEADSVHASHSFPGFLQKEEQRLVRELKDLLGRANALSKQTFLEVVGAYLVRLKAKVDEKGLGRGLPTFISGADERSVLSQLKSFSEFLGQRLVALVVECCTVLKFWEPVRALLERRTLVSTFSRKLVEALVDDDQPLILCLYISSVPDLSPQDLYATLTFFLDSVVNPSRGYELVRRDWRSVTRAEIENAGRREARRSPSGKSVFQRLDRAAGLDDSVSSAVGLAAAFDGFSSPELCIHHLLAKGQDDGVLSSVMSQLSTVQVLRLMKYLGRWIEQYSSYLGNFPAPEHDRVPSFAQVLTWASVILEGHLTQFVLSTEFRDELKSVRDLVQSLVTFGTRIAPLGGITEHIKSQKVLPTRKEQSGAASDYVIELLDIS